MRGTALIVLAWNKWALTARCLDSLLATDLDGAEVLVVDNGSSDETPEAIAAYAGRVRYIRLAENLGFVRGMNAGIAAARPDDDVVLLNNDLKFTQRDWLNRLRDAAYSAPDSLSIDVTLADEKFNTGKVKNLQIKNVKVNGKPYSAPAAQ